jgi:hypothetical protein
MNQFTTQLCLTPIDEDNWKLTSPLVFQSDRLQREIVAPTGFPTDLASVPEFLPLIHKIFADVGKPAAVIHDFLLVEGKVPRPVADEVYLDALYCCPGVPKWKAKAMHWGVSAWTWIKGRFK